MINLIFTANYFSFSIIFNIKTASQIPTQLQTNKYLLNMGIQRGLNLGACPLLGEVFSGSWLPLFGVLKYFQGSLPPHRKNPKNCSPPGKNPVDDALLRKAY